LIVVCSRFVPLSAGQAQTKQRAIAGRVPRPLTGPPRAAGPEDEHRLSWSHVTETANS
jgi:hypothetical protein